MNRIGIIGTGSYLPERILTNAELQRMVETTDEWIFSRTGIRERRIARPDENTSDMAYEASLKPSIWRSLFQGPGPARAGHRDAGHPLPCRGQTGCRLGWIARGGDLRRDGCLLRIHLALSVAEQYLKNDTFKNALVVGAETMTRTVDYTDRSSCILWATGAGWRFSGDPGQRRDPLDPSPHGRVQWGEPPPAGGGSRTTPSTTTAWTGSCTI